MNIFKVSVFRRGEVSSPKVSEGGETPPLRNATFVRHPMYLGLTLAAIGALLIYFTWHAGIRLICAGFGCQG